MAVVGPPVVTLLCVEMGETGWLVLAGLCSPSRWSRCGLPLGLASRERYGVLTHSG